MELQEEDVQVLRMDADSISVSAPGSPTCVALLRHRVMDFARRCPLSESALSDVELAVGEACSNAMRHACPRADDKQVRIQCTKTDCALTVEIIDRGPGFDPASVPMHVAESLREGGMGIYLMQRMMDSVDFEFNHGTTVRLSKRWK